MEKYHAQNFKNLTGVIDIDAELNEAQRRAVVNYNGPSLVIAGAGSGKTRVITYRIAYMLQEGIPAHHVLGLTFTNKASNEMKERINELVQSKEVRYLTMGTFHSIFNRILRSEGHLLGYNKNFTIYDTSDSLSLVKTIIKELQLDKETYKEKTIFSRISSAKNQLITAKIYSENQTLLTQDYRNKIPDFFKIFLLYTERTKLANAMDFDDLLLNTYFLFKKHPNILQNYQNRFRYILVDEFQDTNVVQYEIIKMLGIQHKNVCCVGDDAQSIYSFRGAEIANIIRFKQDFGARIERLEQNYRSTQTIVNAANSIIAKNKNQIKKKVFSELAAGDKILIKELETDFKESEFVAQDIKLKNLTDHLSYNDFTILYRTNHQSRMFEDALRREGIPYVIYGNISFYQRKEIKNVLAYLYLILNPYDDISLLRIINFPLRGIGKTSIAKIQEYAGNRPMWDIIADITSHPVALSTSVKNHITEFANLIKKYRLQLDEKNAFDIAESLINELQLIKEYKEKENDPDKAANIEELLTTIYEYVSENDGEDAHDISLAGFLENVALITDLEKNKQEKLQQDAVKLMTIHTAKGLEFKHVYIVGMEENLFPSFQSIESGKKLEEERRLFYVALTRAMEHITITHCQLRYKYNSQIYPNPSRFLKELDPQYLNIQSSALQTVSSSSTSSSPSSFRSSLKPISSSTPKPSPTATPVPYDTIREGMQVLHQKFGEGTVLSVSGTYPDTKAIISFKTAGEKTLLLKFAKLSVISN